MSKPMLELPASAADSATPLRYPGGKQKLAEFLRRCVVAANDPDLVYIEPYAGGAGAALSLLYSNDVSRIVINDLDPAIYAFWYSAVENSLELQDMVSRVDVTLETWEACRDIYRRADRSDLLELGFATLFLNRTSRSGVLGAGVIGGKAQSGRYKVDARFYRGTMVTRLRQIARLANRIEVRNLDGIQLISELVDDKHSFFYVDPPYYDKGSSLYLNSFRHEDHLELAGCLNGHALCKWILTYDVAPEIADAYGDRRQTEFALRYSAHRAEIARELLIASDAVQVPGLGVAPVVRQDQLI